MSDEEAHTKFRHIRWADNDGEPYCPRCGCTAIYTYRARRVWKCKACAHQFSVTSGTIFASRKLPIRDYLFAIAILMNGAKGISALQLGRDLDVQYRTAFVLCHKLREALAAESKDIQLSGVVEVDGGYVGGHVRPANLKENRRDRRLARNQNRKRRVVIVMRERNGRTLTAVTRYEHQAIEIIKEPCPVGHYGSR